MLNPKDIKKGVKVKITDEFRQSDLNGISLNMNWLLKCDDLYIRDSNIYSGEKGIYVLIDSLSNQHLSEFFYIKYLELA